MSNWEEYAAKRYRHVTLSRQDDIVQVTLGTDGGPVRWGGEPRDDLMHVFHDLAHDPTIRAVVLTGTGEEFTGPRAGEEPRWFQGTPTPSEWDVGIFRGRQMEFAMLSIEVPIIAAVNGPAKRHCELALLCDIVLCSEDSSFEDTAHYARGNLVPGDGVNIVLMALLGMNRARYMMLTGQIIDAREAQRLGLVGEVLPRAQLLPRAWTLARDIAARPRLITRYTRVILTQRIRQEFVALQGYGMALEALADIDRAMEASRKPAS
jgi:enoyl-CoA hydratase/carnithine racemase